jgi:conjugative transfer signal peptidase TraF
MARAMAMKRFHLIALCALGAAFALALTVTNPTSRILYNATPSMPIGLYVKRAAPVAPGAVVTVLARDVAADYAAARGFADPSDRFLKRVVAVGGDLVCARGGVVMINDAVQAQRRIRLEAPYFPYWSECRRLAAQEVFLLGDSPDSFDGRYWGPTPRAAIEDVWSHVGGGSLASGAQW